MYYSNYNKPYPYGIKPPFSSSGRRYPNSRISSYDNGIYTPKYDSELKYAGQYYIPRFEDFPYMGRTRNYLELQDYGPEPFAIKIDEAAKNNTNFRTALWTGEYLQLTLMSIHVGKNIGFELHPDNDQYIRIVEGRGIVMMGDSRDQLDFRIRVGANDIFIIPAGVWHDLINIGDIPLKLYSIYAPPQHPHGTVHETKEDAMGAEENEKNQG